MISSQTHIAVLITCLNGREYLDDLCSSLASSASPQIKQTIVFVDNESTDGSGDYVKEHYPFVDVIRCDHNKGFAGGNNFGFDYIRQNYPKIDYLVLLNTDTVVTKDWLLPLVRFMDANPNAASVQPKIMLHSHPDRFNTVGNRSHYLGFGMMTAYNQEDVSQFNASHTCDFPSGACVMLRYKLLRKYGLFNTKYFMYLEDADLGWKFRIAGYENWYCPDSIIYHKYIPNAPYKYYYYLERNRFILLLTYYRIWTLIVLAPILVFMELGQLVFSLSVGQLPGKLRSYRYFFNRRNLKNLSMQRYVAQLRRRITDRQFTESFVTSIDIPSGSPMLLRFVATPIMAAYWKLARFLIR